MSSLQKMLRRSQPTADNQRQTAIQVKRPLIVLHFLTRRYVYDTILGSVICVTRWVTKIIITKDWTTKGLHRFSENWPKQGRKYIFPSRFCKCVCSCKQYIVYFCRSLRHNAEQFHSWQHEMSQLSTNGQHTETLKGESLFSNEERVPLQKKVKNKKFSYFLWDLQRFSWVKFKDFDWSNSNFERVTPQLEFEVKLAHDGEVTLFGIYCNSKKPAVVE